MMGNEVIVMSQSAYIKLVQGSTSSTITLDDVLKLLDMYRNQMIQTGKQLNWTYEEAAFPYTIELKQEENWFYLKGKAEPYQYMIIGISETYNVAGDVAACIQVVLPEGSTFGDKGKANEFSKFMAKQLKAELTMFNNRTIYYNSRK